ncbi:MAG: sugar phosphate isomerase/epimerase [Lentisphaeria bacterium]|nr:sugar phosphate isomerase/epimerase [Lentisphaeria bacterium]
MPKLSVMLLCYHSGLSASAISPRDLLAAFSEAGVNGLEPAPKWCEDEPVLWSEIQSIAGDLGMDWSCADHGVNFIGDGTAGARQEALDIVARGVEFCRKLGCERMLLPGTKPCEGMSNEDGRLVYGDMLAKAAEQSAGSGITLMIEDFGMTPLFTASAGHCLDVLKGAGDAVKFTFDNGNFLLGGDLPAECYSAFRGRIEHVHIKDFRVRQPDESPSLVSPAGVGYEGCPIGAGDAQPDGCLKLLKADGYDNWLSIEAGGYDTAEPAVQAARFILSSWE